MAALLTDRLLSPPAASHVAAFFPVLRVIRRHLSAVKDVHGALDRHLQMAVFNVDVRCGRIIFSYCRWCCGSAALTDG